MSKGGSQKFWGSFSVEALSFSHVEEGAQKFSTLKEGEIQKLLPCLEGGGGGAKSFETPISLF